MGQVDQAFFPPRYWQQFEELTLGCFKEILNDQHASRNGRSGFPQAGVDVYGHGPDGFTGIQCKQTTNTAGEHLPGTRVTKSQLKSEITKAETFLPRLDVFILATTDTTNPKLQEYVRELNEERKRDGKFRIVLWFWDDYLTFLHTSNRLKEWFYHDILELLNDRDEDLNILSFFAETFHRPAFEDPLSIEDFNAFPQAIQDTQNALRTGQLYDRQTRNHLRQSLSWRRLANPAWRQGMERVDALLSQLRLELLTSLQAKVIIQSNGFMEIRDPLVRDSLDRLRRECVDELNDVLRQAGIHPI